MPSVFFVNSYSPFFALAGILNGPFFSQCANGKGFELFRYNNVALHSFHLTKQMGEDLQEHFDDNPIAILARDDSSLPLHQPTAPRRTRWLKPPDQSPIL
jgi:hypothetical protein